MGSLPNHDLRHPKTPAGPESAAHALTVSVYSSGFALVELGTVWSIRACRRRRRGFESAVDAIVACRLRRCPRSGFAPLMTIYSGLYVLEIQRDEDRLMIETMSLLGRKRSERSPCEILSGKYHRGRRRANAAPSVTAPWIALKMQNKRFPLVIDLRADNIDEEELSRLAQPAVKAWRQDPAVGQWY